MYPWSHFIFGSFVGLLIFLLTYQPSLIINGLLVFPHLEKLNTCLIDIYTPKFFVSSFLALFGSSLSHLYLDKMWEWEDGRMWKHIKSAPYIFFILVLIAICLPFRKLELSGIYPGFKNFSSPLVFYYGLVAISSLFLLRRKQPWVESIILCFSFTMLSLDYWELPFGWISDGNNLLFMIRWRILYVLINLMIFFLFNSYRLNLKKLLLLTTPGILRLGLLPFMPLEPYYWGILGYVPVGVLFYLPFRLISTIAIGYVLLWDFTPKLSLPFFPPTLTHKPNKQPK